MRARRQSGCIAAIVVLAALALALAPAAGATPPWTIQPTVNPTGDPYVLFNGVSCPSANVCTSAGDNFGGSNRLLSASCSVAAAIKGRC